MAIYRGPGGAGDATNDATSQAILAAESAQQAAASAAAASASASQASTSATNSASSATASSNSATAAASSANSASTSATNASNSATAAQTAQTAAETAKTAAETAETNAETAETNANASAALAQDWATKTSGPVAGSEYSSKYNAQLAATSATNAANSATSASTSASAASTSATNAASSATAAASSASAASTSETNAASSATAAAGSATSAASSASTATTQASNAASSATAAATSASNAATSETNAASSASSAATSATNASNSATSASTSATNASNSATSAATSATNAAASASDAADSATEAAGYAASINPSNFLQKANNLSDLTNTTTARTNLGLVIGTNVQAYDADLDAVAGSNVGSQIASYGVNGIGFKNRIINGDMRIDQRNNGAAVTINNAAINQYTLDRFGAYNSTSAAEGIFTVQQDSVVPAGEGFRNSLKVTVTTADASLSAGQFYILSQRIEGFNVADLGLGTAAASTITLSFWVRSSLTGAFGGVLQNGGQNRSYPFSFTISAANTWEKKTITLTGDTSGTWLTTNGTGLEVIWGLGVGSTYLGTAGAWTGSFLAGATGQTNLIGTSGATFYITGVQLEKGSVATPFEYRPYGQELALCQRYYEKLIGAIGGSSGSTITGRCQWFYKTEKRATPTIVQGAGSAAAGVDTTTTHVYGIWRDGGNQPVIGSGSTADSEL